jgi:hypothetical protein
VREEAEKVRVIATISWLFSKLLFSQNAKKEAAKRKVMKLTLTSFREKIKL